MRNSERARWCLDNVHYRLGRVLFVDLVKEGRITNKIGNRLIMAIASGFLCLLIVFTANMLSYKSVLSPQFLHCVCMTLSVIHVIIEKSIKNQKIIQSFK